jgi:hypothetical protein
MLTKSRMIIKWRINDFEKHVTPPGLGSSLMIVAATNIPPRWGVKSI